MHIHKIAVLLHIMWSHILKLPIQEYFMGASHFRWEKNADGAKFRVNIKVLRSTKCVYNFLPASAGKAGKHVTSGLLVVVVG